MTPRPNARHEQLADQWPRRRMAAVHSCRQGTSSSVTHPGTGNHRTTTSVSSDPSSPDGSGRLAVGKRVRENGEHRVGMLAFQRSPFLIQRFLPRRVLRSVRRPRRCRLHLCMASCLRKCRLPGGQENTLVAFLARFVCPAPDSRGGSLIRVWTAKVGVAQSDIWILAVQG